MENNKNIQYTISVYTSNIPNSGISSSNVYIQLFGKKGKKSNKSDQRDTWITKFPLDKSQNSKKFLPGQKDIFISDDINIDKIKKIRLTHDSLSVWHLKKVIIKNNETNRKTHFNCNKYIKSVIDLTPSQPESSDESSKEDENTTNKNENKYKTAVKLNQIRYDLKIKTSQFSKQADNLDIKLIGTQGETNKIKLNSTPSDKDKEKFLTDSLDVFKLMERDIGVLQKISLYCGYNQNENKPCDWYFDYIILDVPSEHSRFKFNSKSWSQVTEDSEKGNTVLEIFPFETKKTSKVKMIYKIELHTKKIKNQFDFKILRSILKNLTVQLFGDFGHSIEAKIHTLPEQMNYHDDSFLNFDFVFHFHARNFDLGEIFKIKLVQKVKSKNLAWYLDRIKIIHDKQSWMFPYEKWVKFNDKDRKREIKIFEEEYRKSRKDFFNENKYSRTMSTLSHRLINEESIIDDSYDESFEEEKVDLKSSERSSPRRQSYTIEKPRLDSSRLRDRSISRDRRSMDTISPIREKKSKSYYDHESSEYRRNRSRSRSLSMERDIEDDLDKRLNLLKKDVNPIKDKQFGYSAYEKIEDKFQSRYKHLEHDDFDRNHSKIEKNKNETSIPMKHKPKEEMMKPTLRETKHDEFKRFNEKIQADHSSFMDDSFNKSKPFGVKKKNELYNIDEELLDTNRSFKEKSYLKNDYDINKPKKTINFDYDNSNNNNEKKSFLKNDYDNKPRKSSVFEFDNEKEWNKIYNDFFDTNKTSSYDMSTSRKTIQNSFNQDKFNMPIRNKFI